jgi:large subunit ribosomal protein L7Ae
MPKNYAKFKIPKEVSDKILQVIEIAKNSGKLRKGTNETTKAIEKRLAQLVVIAEDVEPEEIVMHLPVLCEEKKIPYVFVPSKVDLGRAAGIDVGSASIGIVDFGEAKNQMKDLLKKIDEAKNQ